MQCIQHCVRLQGFGCQHLPFRQVVVPFHQRRYPAKDLNGGAIERPDGVTYLRTVVVEQQALTRIEVTRGVAGQMYLADGLAGQFRYNVMRWHSNSHGFGFQADLITRLLDLNATYIEVPVYPNERAGGETKAFKLRNICSVGHTLLEIWIRRLGKFVYPEATRRPLSELRVYRAGDLGHVVAKTITEIEAADSAPAS